MTNYLLDIFYTLDSIIYKQCVVLIFNKYNILPGNIGYKVKSIK